MSRIERCDYAYTGVRCSAVDRVLFNMNLVGLFAAEHLRAPSTRRSQLQSSAETNGVYITAPEMS